MGNEIKIIGVVLWLLIGTGCVRHILVEAHDVLAVEVPVLFLLLLLGPITLLSILFDLYAGTVVWRRK